MIDITHLFLLTLQSNELKLHHYLEIIILKKCSYLIAKATVHLQPSRLIEQREFKTFSHAFKNFPVVKHLHCNKFSLHLGGPLDRNDFNFQGVK